MRFQMYRELAIGKCGCKAMTDMHSDDVATNALKCGTVPIVVAIGGLDETIVLFDRKTGEGNGFKFSAYEPSAFLEAIPKAVDLFQAPKAWQRLMVNGMKADFPGNDPPKAISRFIDRFYRGSSKTRRS